MRIFTKGIFVFALVLIAGISLSSTNASAQVPPLLYTSGNYAYDVDSKALSFTDAYVLGIMYADGEDGFDDPIVSANISFGTLTNLSNNLVFGPSPIDFAVDGFFTAKISSFNVVESIMEANLNNIQRVDGASSRYLDELLSAGGGNGFISISFTPTEGENGIEDFTSDSSGSSGINVLAAPEPVSSILFLTGGATLAVRRYRKKRI